MKGLSEIREFFNKRSFAEFKLKDGEKKQFRIIQPASELYGQYEHTENFSGNWKTIKCLGKSDCPLCKSGKSASFKLYMPVVDRSDENKVKIFKASKKVTNDLAGFNEEYGTLTDRDYSITRTGEKLATTYQIIPKKEDKDDISKYELPDLESMIESTFYTKEAIDTLIEGTVVTDTPDLGVAGDDDSMPF